MHRRGLEPLSEERVSLPLQRAVVGYLAREQEARGATDEQMAGFMGIVTSAWGQMRRGRRGIGLEALMRAIQSGEFDGLLGLVFSFLARSVRDKHIISEEQHKERVRA